MGDEDLLKLFGVENGCLPEVTAEEMMLLRDVIIRQGGTGMSAQHTR